MPNISGKGYVYSNLKGASGSVNVIAVVKYHAKPKRTRGSGFSLFVSITDPSLNGDKMPCVLFNDSRENLPPVQAPGDVIVMHRLVIREFHGRVQACGYASTGFAATVFSGQIDDPLTPRPCPSVCSFGESELDRVKELRCWYNSPECPVEREQTNLLALPVSTIPRSEASILCNFDEPDFRGTGQTVSQPVQIKRLWTLHAREFVSIQGQIVSIYPHLNENQCVVLYLWDGSPSTSITNPSTPNVSSHQSLPNFFALPKDYLTHLSPTSLHKPELVAITAHRLCTANSSNSNADDWSVPVVIYDEHASTPPVTELEPGDLVQINNVHVLSCRPPDCPIPGCLRIIVHGGGHRFARGVQRLGPASMLDDYVHRVNSGQNLPDPLQSVNQFGLLANLHEGMLRRPCVFTVPGVPTRPLTMAQLCNLPHWCDQIEAEKFHLPFPNPNNSGLTIPIPPDSWVRLPVHRDLNARRRTMVRVRLIARVDDVCPRHADDLRDLILLACERCQSAVRVSCLLDPNEDVCQCDTPRKRRTTNTSQTLAIVPFVFLIVQDATRSCVLSASGLTVLDLLRIPDLSMNGLIEELIVMKTNTALASATPHVDRFLQALHKLKDQWLNVLVRVSWRAEWDLCASTPLDKLQMKLELMQADPSPSDQHHESL